MRDDVGEVVFLLTPAMLFSGPVPEFEARLFRESPIFTRGFPIAASLDLPAIFRFPPPHSPVCA